MEIDIKGYKVLIDDEDYELVSKYTWHVDDKKYMRSNVYVGYYKYNKIKMHRLIMGLENNGGEIVDHISGDVLDNRKSNLRVCTHAENMQNRKKQKNNTSGIKGVYWNIQKGKWMAYISVNRKQINLGCFDDINEAKKVHDEAAIKYHGEFARLN